MSPLRLLFVTHTLAPEDRPLASIGGMQRVAEELYRALSVREDVDVTLLGLRTSWKWIGPKTTLFLARILSRLPAHVERSGAEVVLFSSMVTASLAPGLRRRLPGVRLAAIAHGRDVKLKVPLYQWWLPRVFRALDTVLPVSAATGEECVERGAARSKVVVCRNGVNVDRFVEGLVGGLKERLEVKLGIEPGSFILLSVGRQVERKGTAWFVQNVLPRLPPHVHYVVAGDGPELEHIAEAAERAGAPGRVHLAGWVSDDELRRLLQSADLFVMPNVPVEGDMEGFGVVTLEAALSGLYTVASRLEGITDAVEEGQSGALVEPADAEAYARVLLPLVADPRRAVALGQQARHYVLTTHNWSSAAERYVSALLPASL